MQVSSNSDPMLDHLWGQRSCVDLMSWQGPMKRAWNSEPSKCGAYNLLLRDAVTIFRPVLLYLVTKQPESAFSLHSIGVACPLSL